MIISLHLPKTAGTSFLACLETYFEKSLLADYEDTPINAPPEERNRSALEKCMHNEKRDFTGIECIHGHFLPLKYLLASMTRPMRFITWMRNPVDRMISHYHFWKKSYDRENSAALHRKMVEEDWSLERLCLGPELRNIYCQFLWGFPVRNFQFIGITEFFEEDLNYFAQQFLGTRMEAQTLNTSEDQKGERQIDGNFRRKMEAYHAEDMALYKIALEKRTQRCL